MERVDRVARLDVPVLILGETGAGKEVVARAIHARSRRAGGPFLRVNCGAIPAGLIDSELFGHERGSFTGAVGERKGWFERADGGTLFLDEIGELPPDAQVRLLRVLQDGTLERVGGHRQITVDVRIVAATHRDLQALIAERPLPRGSLVPGRGVPDPSRAGARPRRGHPGARDPLRAARGDALRHAAAAADRGRSRSARALPVAGQRARALRRDGARRDPRRRPTSSTWRARSGRCPDRAPRRRGARLRPRARPIARLGAPPATLDAAMAAHIEAALARARGRIEGEGGAAELLGINPHTLRARMRKLGVDWRQFRRQAR